MQGWNPCTIVKGESLRASAGISNIVLRQGALREPQGACLGTFGRWVEGLVSALKYRNTRLREGCRGGTPAPSISRSNPCGIDIWFREQRLPKHKRRVGPSRASGPRRLGRLGSFGRWVDGSGFGTQYREALDKGAGVEPLHHRKGREPQGLGRNMNMVLRQGALREPQGACSGPRPNGLGIGSARREGPAGRFLLPIRNNGRGGRS